MLSDTKKTVLETLHRQMIAEIQDYAIILLDIDGTILSWNAGVEKIKGYKEHEILGKNFRIFYLPQDRIAGLPEQLIDLATREGRARQ
ncbi:MAG TPA: PAS domain S-box protein [Flavobacterium sp.]